MKDDKFPERQQVVAQALNNLMKSCGMDEWGHIETEGVDAFIDGVTQALRQLPFADHCTVCNRVEYVGPVFPDHKVEEGLYAYQCPRCGHEWTCAWGRAETPWTIVMNGA